jgi:hypothetical protein
MSFELHGNNSLLTLLLNNALCMHFNSLLMQEELEPCECVETLAGLMVPSVGLREVP